MYWLTFMLLWASSLASGNGNLHLKHVSMVWRHGARSPLHTYPSDPYNDEPLWPQGPGQLSQIGMQQQYNLGMYIRERYSELLSSNYSRQEIYIRSTSIDRALMSAESNLAGLYPPRGRQMWNGSDTSWQPIPIHTVSTDDDHLLLYFSNCPKYVEFYQKVLDSPQYNKFKEKYKGFLTEIQPFTGFKDDFNILDSKCLFDALACEKGANLSLPGWVTDSRFKQLSKLIGFYMGFESGASTEFNIPMAKMGAGFLVKQIIENMEQNANNQSQGYLANLYSAHDTTLIALMVALDAYNMEQPPFASSLMFELYEDQSENAIDQFVVKAFYRNSVSNPPIELNLLGCDLNCPLSELKSRAMAILPSGDKPDCGVTDSPTQPISTATPTKPTDILSVTRLLYITASVLFLTWFVLLVAFCRRKRKPRKDLSYQPLNSYDQDA